MNTYYIKDLESLTGIKAHTIRIWEQRYNLVTPKRTSTNIRFYDDEDVKLLLNIALLNKKGLKISKIACLDAAEIHIQALIACKQRNENDDLINSLILATYKLDEGEINKIIANQIMIVGFENTLTKLVFPYLQRLGDLWVSNALNPALEHFATNIIKKKIQIAAEGVEEFSKEQKFLLFLPPGEMHEMGLLFANYIIKKEGFNVLYLGQNTPIEDLSAVMDNFKADYILSVFTASNPSVEPIKFVNEVVTNWPEVKILLAGIKLRTDGGQSLNSPKYKNKVTLLNEPAELKQYLDKIV
jgi:DNA-binding transcriptional MerR regulator